MHSWHNSERGHLRGHPLGQCCYGVYGGGSTSSFMLLLYTPVFPHRYAVAVHSFTFLPCPFHVSVSILQMFVCLYTKTMIHICLCVYAVLLQNRHAFSHHMWVRTYASMYTMYTCTCKHRCICERCSFWWVLLTIYLDGDYRKLGR